MPKAVEKAVDSMLKSKDFYPDKDDKERKSLAYAIANKNAKAKKQTIRHPWETNRRERFQIDYT